MGAFTGWLGARGRRVCAGVTLAVICDDLKLLSEGKMRRTSLTSILCIL